VSTLGRPQYVASCGRRHTPQSGHPNDVTFATWRANRCAGRALQERLSLHFHRLDQCKDGLTGPACHPFPGVTAL